MMAKKPKLQWDPILLRPMLYQLFTRAVMGTTAALLADFFVPRDVRQLAFAAVALLCAVMAWCAWMRLDGLKLLSIDRRLFRRKKTPERAYGDLIDFTDEPIVSFDELEDSEKDTCLVLSNGICCLGFLLTAMII